MISSAIKSVVAGLAFAGALSAVADVSVSPIFAPHMVLQREKPVPVWGRADPGEAVTVSFAGQKETATADEKGFWQVVLKPLSVSKEERTMTIAGKNTLTFGDVLVGDVWLVSGQSNAEMSFSWGILNGAAEMAASTNYPSIRHIKVQRTSALIPSTQDIVAGLWEHCTAKTLPGVTAEGYFFARMLNRETGIPIGIIDDNWSGCRIEPFCAPEGYELVFDRDPYYKNAWTTYVGKLNQAVQNAKTYLSQMERIAALGTAERPSDFSLDFVCNFNLGLYNAFGQYNAMIAPIVRFPIAGATWYQGCSNSNEGLGYEAKLEALVGGWRAKWGYDFPFYIVQLSSFREQTKTPEGGDGYAAIREAQRLGAKKIAKSGLVVTTDIGNATDIHPKNKLDVGERLARWALRDVYGQKDLVVSGPQPKAVTPEGDKIRISFDHVGTGLMAAEKDPNGPGIAPTPLNTQELKGFSVAGADKKWYFAKAVIDGETVVVSAPEVKEPVLVRYAYRGNPMGASNLYNAEGLPASPFTSENVK